MPNRLADAISPYLQQHADNPVDWCPWDAEALDRAKQERKPIFLSIGYAACHWCHVMAHESFENQEIARVLNENFIPIKVDREERPDLDQIYMEAVQMMTGHGGWPMSVFLAPSLEPFFGGTYWPPRPRGGMPGFNQVLAAVIDIWKNRREQALQQGQQMAAVLRDTRLTEGEPGKASQELLRNAEARLARSFDPQFGGFGGAPKFPHPLDLRVLLRGWYRTGQEHLLSMVTTTLNRMASGGIYDHLGGGFHRYSTDAHWLVPHFEKMLYDNALLAVAYLEAYQATGRPQYAQVVQETMDYVLRDMTHPQGGFYSTEDADSEGEEGKFYVWTPKEIDEVLGPERAKAFSYVYDVSEQGNFEGNSILNIPKPLDVAAKLLARDVNGLRHELAEDRCRLFGRREARVRPGRDDKVLVSWNGLMIDAFAQAGAVLGQCRYTEAATSAASFLLEQLRDKQGRLMHVWRDGRALHPAYLDDCAGLANSLVSLYETTFEERWIDEAVQLADELLHRFADPEEGGFFYAAEDHQALIARKKDMLDSSVPSGGGLATTVLLRLGKLCGRSDYLDAVDRALAASSRLMDRAPMGTGQLLLALDMHLGPTPELVMIGSPDQDANAELLSELRTRFLPSKIVAYREDDNAERASKALSGIFAGKRPIPPGPTLFVCENFACKEPVSGSAAVAAIGALAQRPKQAE
jgi:uncharacterized protein YyaL (SSP411 family)